MTTLNNILTAHLRKHIATDTGLKTHTILQHLTTKTGLKDSDPDLINKIKQTPELSRFFTKDSKTELPIAGTLNGKFISRRIDRININHTTKTIDILDYKTDTTHDKYYKKYKIQINEYIALLQQIYPDYQINGYILWTHDFLLEKIPVIAL